MFGLLYPLVCHIKTGAYVFVTEIEATDGDSGRASESPFPPSWKLTSLHPSRCPSCASPNRCASPRSLNWVTHKKGTQFKEKQQTCRGIQIQSFYDNVQEREREKKKNAFQDPNFTSTFGEQNLHFGQDGAAVEMIIVNQNELIYEK